MGRGVRRGLGVNCSRIDGHYEMKREDHEKENKQLSWLVFNQSSQKKHRWIVYEAASNKPSCQSFSKDGRLVMIFGAIAFHYYYCYYCSVVDVLGGLAGLPGMIKATFL